MAACPHRRLVFVPQEDDPDLLAELCLDCHTILSVTGPDDPELRAIGESLIDPRENPGPQDFTESAAWVRSVAEGALSALGVSHLRLTVQFKDTERRVAGAFYDEHSHSGKLVFSKQHWLRMSDQDRLLTVIHEAAHLAVEATTGHLDGHHGQEWHSAMIKLGISNPRAVIREGEWESGPRMNPPADRMRELERRAKRGDGQAALDLLKAQQQAGQLPQVRIQGSLLGPGINSTLPGAGSWQSLIDSQDAFDFVNQVLAKNERMLSRAHPSAAGFTAQWGEEFPFDMKSPAFGSDLASDVLYLSNLHRQLAYQHRENALTALFQSLWPQAAEIMISTGYEPDSAREAVAYLIDYPEVVRWDPLAWSGDLKTVLAIDYAVWAAEWLNAVNDGYLDELRQHRRRARGG